MVDQPKVSDSTVVRQGGVPIRALDGLGALNVLVSAARECYVIHREETSKRAKIAAYETTEVARIKAAESLLRGYFAQVFAERARTFDDLFERFDTALDQGNSEALNLVVKSIVDVAKTSPLADLDDLSQVRAALDDPDFVWDL